MSRQNTDLNYIEVGYFTPEEYYVYTANAESAQQVTSTMSCDAGKIVSAQSNLEVTTTTTCTISHIEGADLFAFSESQIQITIDRIRDNNIAAVTDSDLSSIVASIRSFESAEIFEFDLSVINVRSRDVNLETQAAFSFTAEGERFSLQETGANLVTESAISILVDKTVNAIIALEQQSTVSAVVSKISDVNSTSNSQSTVSALASKTADGSASLESTTAVSATISHIEGADLQAFGQSELSATVDKIVSALINLVSETVQSTVNERIRSTDSNVASTVELSSSIDVNRQATVALAVESQQSTQISRLRSAESTVSSDSTQSVINDRLRGSSLDISTVADFTCTISHIEGADLAAFGAAALTATANVDYVGDVSLATQFNQQTQAAKSVVSGSSISSRSSIFVSRNAGTNPPVTVTGTFDSTSLINSATRSSNLSDIPQLDNWFFYTEITVDPSGTWATPPSGTAGEFFRIPLGTRNGISVQIVGEIERYDTNLGVQRVITFSGLGLTVAQGFRRGQPVGGSGAFASGPVTSKLAVSFTGGQRIAVYIDGSRVGLVEDAPTNNWSIPGLVNVQFAAGFPYTVSSSVHTAFTNVSWLTGGNYSNSGAESLPQIVPTYTEDTIFLYNFNNNGQETRNLTFIGDAALANATTVTATLSGPVRISAALAATSTMSVVGAKTSEIILTAFGDSQVNVVADKIRSFEASLAASTDVSALTAAVKDAIASQAAEFAQTTTAVKTVSAEAAISGITVSLTAVARIRSGDIQANVESQLTVNGNITAAGSSALASTTVVSTIGERIRYQDANLISDCELNALPLNIKQLESQQSTDVEQTVSANITAAADIAMQGITISLTALGAIRTGLISMSVEATQTTVAVKTTDVTVSANSQTTVSATGIIQVDFEADLVSASALQSSGERIRYADSQIVSTAAQVSDVNYIADFQATLDSTSDVSATPRGIVSITASLAAEFTQVSVPSRTRDQQLTFNSQTDIAISTNDSLTRNAESQQSSTTVLNADVGRIRPFEATLVANTIDLFVVAKIGAGLIDATVNTVLTATANINAVGSAVLDSTTTADITAVKTTDVDSAFNSDTAVVAEGTTNIIGESQMAVETLVSAQSVVTYSASVSVNASTELAATARVIRGLALLEQSSGTLSCDVSRIREVTCDFASVSIDLIFGDRIVLANANLSSQFNLSAQGREIDLTKYVYVIRNEVRTWEIPEETRIYTIRRF